MNAVEKFAEAVLHHNVCLLMEINYVFLQGARNSRETMAVLEVRGLR